MALAGLRVGYLLASPELVREVNNYVTEQEPWKLAKDPEQADKLNKEFPQFNDLLVAVMRNDGTFHELARVGGGFTDEDRRTMRAR